MRGKYYKLKFIELLREVPFISYAVKKSGVVRSTIYRWIKNDPDFRKAVDSAIMEGRGQLGDLTEMKLVENIKEKNMGAIKFFLQHNDPRYMSKYNTAILPPQNKPKKPGQYCRSCGHEELSELSDEEIRERVQKGIIDLQNIDQEFETAALDRKNIVKKRWKNDDYPNVSDISIRPKS